MPITTTAISFMNNIMMKWGIFMARRDYNHDGKIDWYDEMIEQDLLCDDDEELESHFESLHNSLKNPRASSSYSSSRSSFSQNVDKNKVFADFEYKPSWGIIILFGFGLSVAPPLALFSITGVFSFLISVAVGIDLAYWILKLQDEKKDIEDKEKYGYIKYLENKYPHDAAQRRIEEFRKRRSDNENGWCLFGIVFLIGIVLTFVAAYNYM